MILVLRTDSMTPELYLTQTDGNILAGDMWEAGRGLSDELLSHIVELFENNDAKLDQLTGVIIFSGPGSFTSLRIGHTVANALADSLGIPIVGQKEDGWITSGAQALKTAKPGVYALPFYGSEANITKPKA